MDDDWTCLEFAPLDDLPKVSGVYFLMNGFELVYVGQSKNIRSRVRNHHNMWNCTLFSGDKPLEEDTFDSIYYLEVDYKPERKSYEGLSNLKSQHIKLSDFLFLSSPGELDKELLQLLYFLLEK